MPELNFTKAAVAAIAPAPAGTRTTWHDTQQPGLILRVTSTGAKSYYFYGRVKGGGPERVRIGDADTLTPTQARAKAKEISLRLSQGESFAGANKVLRAESTLNDLLGQYLARVPMKPRSLAEYQGLQRRYVAPALGGLKLSKITTATLARLHGDVTVGRVPEGLKGGPTTANRLLALLKAAFTWAIDAGMLSGMNPAARIQKNREISRDRYVQPHELGRFFASLEQAPQTARDFFLLSVLTGARRSNVGAMRWVDVNLPAGIWIVPGAQSKNGSPLTVTLAPEAVGLLEARKGAADASAFVFPGTGVSGHYTEPKRAWNTLKKRSGLDGLRIHDLRRTLGAWLVRTGSSTAINMHALGHSSLQAAQVYQRIADTDPVRQAVDKATSAMLAGGGMKPSAQLVPVSKTA